MKRGDFVAAADPGAYGTPRPASILQADMYVLATCTLAPLLRIPVEPNAENGLQKLSQAMIDKIVAASRSKIGHRLGALDHATLKRVNRALMALLALDDDAP